MTRRKEVKHPQTKFSKPLVETLADKWVTYRVEVTTQQVVEVCVPEGTTSEAIKDKANMHARYEGECYDIQILSNRPATKDEINDADQS